ncbi:histamine N-methyltransferase-like isoform X2 [Boleophthalmus pectinirostris]|uniref:histamine N-methyltransferase-like isoform X2 n=1 Tax=Boleophthalmus pectinirostris TaxID=150288 RepID=UPI00242EAA5D|nr:histamine N-methyltransferase-like isoform X2 [Boleophthalmus pectinirostris]
MSLELGVGQGTALHFHQTACDVITQDHSDPIHSQLWMHTSGHFTLKGKIDLEMISQLRLKHPGVLVDNEVVEPSSQQLHNYKVMVNQKPDLDYIKFTWNKMTASEFEEQWRQNNITKKADFIHMVQVLYYVKDPGATINFFQSLLDKNGKLLILLVSGDSGWGKLWETFRSQLCNTEISQCVTTADIKSLLDARRVPYKSYELQSHMDITECFTDGDETGELMLDFLTEVLHFSKTASPELRQGVLRLLRDPQCSLEKEGRVLFNNNLGVIVVDALS